MIVFEGYKWKSWDFS